MIHEALRIEGTWEQVVALSKSLAGKQVRLTVLSPQPTHENSAEVSIEEAFAEIMADLTQDEQAKLPADLAEQHDHYIYGWPKNEVGLR